jgi:hypothetical protein
LSADERREDGEAGEGTKDGLRPDHLWEGKVGWVGEGEEVDLSSRLFERGEKVCALAGPLGPDRTRKYPVHAAADVSFVGFKHGA